MNSKALTHRRARRLNKRAIQRVAVRFRQGKLPLMVYIMPELRRLHCAPEAVDFTNDVLRHLHNWQAAQYQGSPQGGAR